MLQVEQLRQEKLEIDQQLRTIGADRGEYREEYRGGNRDYRGSYDNENYHRQSHDYRDSYQSGTGGGRDGGYSRNMGSGNMGSFRDQQGM